MIKIIPKTDTFILDQQTPHHIIENFDNEKNSKVADSLFLEQFLDTDSLLIKKQIIEQNNQKKDKAELRKLTTTENESPK